MIEFSKAELLVNTGQQKHLCSAVRKEIGNFDTLSLKIKSVFAHQVTIR